MPPPWLEAFQARFSAMLRTPLDRSSGTLRAQTERFDRAACADVHAGDLAASAERLAVYNRQYWFRLFDALQKEYPLTTRLVGAWTFNDWAQRFLEAHPPSTADLARAGDGFADFLATVLPASGATEVPWLALVEAARIDDAFRCVLRAPAQPVLDPVEHGAEQLAQRKLAWSEAVREVQEHWPLLALRSAANGGSPLPPAHDVPRAWLLCRTPTGTHALPLAPLQAQLFQRLRHEPLERALRELEQRTPAEQRAGLAADAQRWLAEGMRLRLWTGLE